MNNKPFDIIVPKEFETVQDGRTVKKVKWNRVGHAWPSRSGESLSFELYLIPNQRYVIKLTDKKEDTQTESIPF